MPANQTNMIDEATIEAEYRRLDHKLGWRFLACPKSNIETASIALVTTNPGGWRFEEPKWSVEKGNAYEIEEWEWNKKKYPPGQQPLQRQVLRLFELVGAKSPAEVLTGYFVPFRSRGWKTLHREKESRQFGLKLWGEVFKGAKNVRTIVAFGKGIEQEMVKLLDAEFVKDYPAHWGKLTIDEYRFGANGKLVMLPHLSRHSLFNRCHKRESETSLQDAIANGR